MEGADRQLGFLHSAIEESLNPSRTQTYCIVTCNNKYKNVEGLFKL